jgi:thiosulfate reductase cytochrome b subunit
MLIQKHNGSAKPPVHTMLIRRHSGVTRATHWINVLCMTVLLLSGLQILNVYPTLNWGKIGTDSDPYLAPYRNQRQRRAATGRPADPGTRLCDHRSAWSIQTQRGVDGASVSELGTLPSGIDLATGRRWHFFFAWLFVANGLSYLATAIVRGHFARDLLPSGKELNPRNLWHEILDHARLRFPRGDAARHYNALQKLTHVIVIAVLLPPMVLTGLAMSPGMDSVAPVLPDLFGGRPSARTVHFFTASSLVLFFMVHILMVLLSGPLNNMRSMITGRYAINIEGDDQ